MSKETINPVIKNKKAYHDYFILDTVEAGIELQGTEVKSVRNSQVNLKDSYIKIVNGEAFLLKTHISPYDYGGYVNHEPERKRKLLLHKKEIDKLVKKIERQGLTLVPLQVYFNSRGKIKVEVGVAKGKQTHDKRDAIADRDAKRDIERQRKDF